LIKKKLHQKKINNDFPDEIEPERKPQEKVNPQQKQKDGPKKPKVTKKRKINESQELIVQTTVDPLMKNYLSSVEVRMMLLVTAVGMALILGVYLKLQTKRVRFAKDK